MPPNLLMSCDRDQPEAAMRTRPGPVVDHGVQRQKFPDNLTAQNKIELFELAEGSNSDTDIWETSRPDPVQEVGPSHQPRSTPV